MRYEIYILLAFAAVAMAQSKNAPKVDESLDRSFFNLTTFTILRFSTTTTSTFTSTTTCTTSTASLSACTAGRRRRNLFYDEGEAQGKVRRGLFYNDDDKDESAFISGSDDPVDEVKAAKKPASVNKPKDQVVPLEIQSGYALPDGVSVNRFLLAFGTSTITSVTITTATSSITATCSSITGFSTCGSSGK